MNELALFAGAGGGVLASYLLGWQTVCAVERDAYAAQVLAQRQNDGILEAFPIWSDITTFDGKPWQGIVDVISGGFPCQDISSAGKGAGIEGERSGLWSEMARIIGEVRPRYVFVENSPMLVSRGLTRVISDLAKMGYDAQWARFSASNFGAPHIRDRIWIVAYARCQRGETGASQTLRSKREIPKWKNPNYMGSNISNTQSIGCQTNRLSIRAQQEKSLSGINGKDVANPKSIGLEQARQCKPSSEKWFTRCGNELSDTNCERCKQVEQRVLSRTQSKGPTDSSQHSSFARGWEWWAIEPELGRVADGVANRVDRLKAIGNGQVSIVAKCAFEYLGGTNE
ncbi:DNA cytosine methyltransferase [Acinetobacter baumannii]|uniref:DNA cytosine methyltransferase n=1 Tax=Acinetobacter baumannii TaxID=470 RepID=UPI0007A47ED8|nr:DNA cytosine methyltransferase [Acinetobacter baumannii]EHU2654852.1 DNA cytosine methyltransferase [Acinetobacter baumannii]EHU2723797.1 DNA cytosine methyltransferase [Acinetobacter baumannii]EHU2841905.1 DNA cytosine methyltransferase [Acinetobacter baumannii]EHU3378819.1 DNA cytosine methyltransferase [Acinetobacter baumannii]EHU3391295.1 DNA cytosine methyltransferase [Acinetobacter baumannii]